MAKIALITINKLIILVMFTDLTTIPETVFYLTGNYNIALGLLLPRPTNWASQNVHLRV